MSTTEPTKTFTCKSCKTNDVIENAMLLHWCDKEVASANEIEAAVAPLLYRYCPMTISLAS